MALKELYPSNHIWRGQSALGPDLDTKSLIWGWWYNWIRVGDLKGNKNIIAYEYLNFGYRGKMGEIVFFKKNSFKLISFSFHALITTFLKIPLIWVHLWLQQKSHTCHRIGTSSLHFLPDIWVNQPSDDFNCKTCCYCQPLKGGKPCSFWMPKQQNM